MNYETIDYINPALSANGLTAYNFSKENFHRFFLDNSNQIVKTGGESISRLYRLPSALYNSLSPEIFGTIVQAMKDRLQTNPNKLFGLADQSAKFAYFGFGKFLLDPCGSILACPAEINLKTGMVSRVILATQDVDKDAFIPAVFVEYPMFGLGTISLQVGLYRVNGGLKLVDNTLSTMSSVKVGLADQTEDQYVNEFSQWLTIYTDYAYGAIESYQKLLKQLADVETSPAQSLPIVTCLSLPKKLHLLYTRYVNLLEAGVAIVDNQMPSWPVDLLDVVVALARLSSKFSGKSRTQAEAAIFSGFIRYFYGSGSSVVVKRASPSIIPTVDPNQQPK